MINQKTLSAYLFRLYLGYFIGFTLILVGILAVSNLFDLLQKFKTVNIPGYLFWRLILYKLPYLVNELSPIISLIAMLFFLKRLTKYNELVIILCSGTHIWRVISIPVFTTIIIGIIFITALNPLSTLGLQKYESIIAKITANQHNNLIISKSGIVFYENYYGRKRIIQAGSIDVANSILSNITILFVNDNNSLLERIDAKAGILTNHQLKLTSVTINNNNQSKKYESFVIATNLSITKLLNNYTSPEIVSIWDLPELIQQLSDSGLPVRNYQVYYYKQLFKPIIMSTSVVLAACFFSLRHRDNSQAKSLMIGLATGFIVYSLTEVILKVLSYNDIPDYLAVLLPNICILFLSNFVIMHSQDN